MSSFIKKKIGENKEKLLIHYKNFLKGILVTFGGIMWGSLIQIFFLPRGTRNIGALTLTFLIACLLGYRLQWYKTLRHKIIILFLVLLLVSSPIIGLCIFPSIDSISRIDKAKEVATMGNLGFIRSSIATYYKENKIYPITLDNQSRQIGTLTVSGFIPKYVEKVPKAHLSKKIPHVDSNTILIINTKPNQKIQPHQITDKGGWIYSSNSGDIRINCNHKDSKGVYYFEY
ncbi:MAG: hypothetical protein QME42_01200 [bacterium]|nr:hypothetical protein [bacterium]